MTIEERSGEVVGNPVRRDALLRSLRSNGNAVILAVWSALVAAVGIAVLVDRIGLGNPFRAGAVNADMVGASLGQWWIVTVTIGTILVAVVLAAVGCAAAGERHRLQAWSATLVGPWRITMGIWRAQLALILLALVLALPVGGVAVAMGGTTPRQCGIALLAAAIGGASASASTIALACRAKRVIAPLVTSLVIIAGVFVVPYASHVARDRPTGDPAMAVVPVVGAADAVAPLPAPPSRFGTDCADEACGWNAANAADAPLDGLRSTVRPWSGQMPPWGWTTIGAFAVTIVALFVTRLRIARPPRR